MSKKRPHKVRFRVFYKTGSLKANGWFETVGGKDAFVALLHRLDHCSYTVFDYATGAVYELWW